MYNIKTTKNWQRHLPHKAGRVSRGSYNYNDHKKRNIFIIFIVIVVLFLIQSIFQAPFLKIEKIAISNNNDLSSDEITQDILNDLSVGKYFIFKTSNYFLTDTDSIKNDLIKSYNLDNATVTKKFPDRLDVLVQEKISQFIWQKDDTLYLLNEKGSVNREIGAIDDKYLVLEDARNFFPTDNQAFNESEINKINEVYISWEEYIKDIKLTRIKLDDNWSLMELYTNVGFFVKLDSNKDIKSQIQNLQQVLEAENLNGTDIAYIDVRFDDKVYFK